MADPRPVALITGAANALTDAYKKAKGKPVSVIATGVALSPA